MPLPRQAGYPVVCKGQPPFSVCPGATKNSFEQLQASGLSVPMTSGEGNTTGNNKRISSQVKFYHILLRENCPTDFYNFRSCIT